MMFTLSQTVVALTGFGYFAVGIDQILRGNASGSIIWVGYAFAQIGLYLQLK